MEDLNVHEEMSDWSDDTAGLMIHETNAASQSLSSNEENESENEPIAVLIERARQKMEEISENEAMEDSGADNDYQPSKEDINSSDSEMSESTEKLIKGSRKQAWKKKRGKNIKRKLFKSKHALKHLQLLQEKIKKKHQALRVNRSKMLLKRESNILEKVKLKSKKINSLKQILKRHHVRRIDNLLACNGFQRSPVTADGDCFFAALQLQMQENMPTELFRQQIADHLIRNTEHYINFLHDDEASPENRSTRFVCEVQQIKEKGQWKTNIADCIPLAAANLLQKQIKIFSSDISNPVYDIKPDLTPDYDRYSYLYLAYLKIRGEEHYDGVVKSQGRGKQTTTNTSTTPVKPQPTMEDADITPHKEAVYRSPKIKESTRKKNPTPELWKRNVRKRNRSCGLAYMSQTGKHIQPRSIKEVDCSKCKFKCTNNINDGERQNIFDTYWSLQDYIRQRDFICRTVKDSTPKRIKTGRKKTSFQYAFEIGNEKSVRVCKRFYLDTLGIGKKTVSTAMAKKVGCVFAGSDNRGKQPSANKTSSEEIKVVRTHIESFPTMEAHYVRKQSRRKYLSHDLNITKMWYMYKHDCDSKNVKPVSQAKYRKIFCEEYNYSFFKPKKDQCAQCTRFDIRIAESTSDATIQERQDAHLRRKDNAREQKSTDKMKAKNDPTFYAATFDLHRNKFVVSAYLYAISKAKSLDVINHKFFEPGHSQMESDSMHSAIENAKKKTYVYVPSQWHTVISLARRKKPYIVVPVRHTDILNLKEFSNKFCPNMKVTTNNVRVNWLKIVWIKVEKKSPGSVFVSETFDENDLMEIRVSSNTRSKNQFPNVPTQLEPCYKAKLPISDDNKQDLLSLCQNGMIPEEFHSYYTGISTSKHKRDCLPVPDQGVSDTEYETESDED